MPCGTWPTGYLLTRRVRTVACGASMGRVLAVITRDVSEALTELSRMKMRAGPPQESWLDACFPTAPVWLGRAVFASPSLWEGRAASGRGGLRAASNAEPSPRFARPSQGEGDEKRFAKQQRQDCTTSGNGRVVILGRSPNYWRMRGRCVGREDDSLLRSIGWDAMWNMAYGPRREWTRPCLRGGL